MRQGGALALVHFHHFDADVVAAEAVDEAGGRRAPSWSPMSSCTSGVAVAVRATTGAGRSSGRYWPMHAVIGAEIVAPLGDAVGFVDGDQATACASRASRGSRPRAGVPAR